MKCPHCGADLTRPNAVEGLMAGHYTDRPLAMEYDKPAGHDFCAACQIELPDPS